MVSINKTPADMLEEWQERAEDMTYFRIALEGMRLRTDTEFTVLMGGASLIAFFINKWLGAFLFVVFILLFATVMRSHAKLEVIRQIWLEEDKLRGD